MTRINTTDNLENPAGPGVSPRGGVVPARRSLEVTIPEIQRELNCPEPSTITGKNSQMQEKGWECFYPNPELDETISWLLWMRNSPEGRTVAPSGCHRGVGHHREEEEENPAPPKTFHPPEEEQRTSRGDPGPGIGCGQFWKSSWESRESPKEIQGLGLGCGQIHGDIVSSGKAQQLPRPGFASSFVYLLWSYHRARKFHAIYRDKAGNSPFGISFWVNLLWNGGNPFVPSPEVPGEKETPEGACGTPWQGGGFGI